MKQGIFTKQFDYHGTPVEAFIRWETNRDKHTTLIRGEMGFQAPSSENSGGGQAGHTSNPVAENTITVGFQCEGEIKQIPIISNKDIGGDLYKSEPFEIERDTDFNQNQVPFLANFYEDGHPMTEIAGAFPLDKLSSKIGAPQNLDWYDGTNFSRNGNKKKSPHDKEQAFEWTWEPAEDGVNNPVVGYEIGYREKPYKTWSADYVIPTTTEDGGWEKDGDRYYAWLNAADVAQGTEIQFWVQAKGADGTVSEKVYSQPKLFGNLLIHQRKAIAPQVIFSARNQEFYTPRQYQFGVDCNCDSSTVLDEQGNHVVYIEAEFNGKKVRKQISIPNKEANSWAGNPSRVIWVGFTNEDFGLLPKEMVGPPQEPVITVDTGYYIKSAKTYLAIGKNLTGGGLTLSPEVGLAIELPKIDDEYNLTGFTARIEVFARGADGPIPLLKFSASPTEESDLIITYPLFNSLLIGKTKPTDATPIQHRIFARVSLDWMPNDIEYEGDFTTSFQSVQQVFMLDGGENTYFYYSEDDLPVLRNNLALKLDAIEHYENRSQNMIELIVKKSNGERMPMQFSNVAPYQLVNTIAKASLGEDEDTIEVEWKFYQLDSQHYTLTSSGKASAYPQDAFKVKLRSITEAKIEGLKEGEDREFLQNNDDENSAKWESRVTWQQRHNTIFYIHSATIETPDGQSFTFDVNKMFRADSSSQDIGCTFENKIILEPSVNGMLPNSGGYKVTEVHLFGKKIENCPMVGTLIAPNKKYMFIIRTEYSEVYHGERITSDTPLSDTITENYALLPLRYMSYAVRPNSWCNPKDLGDITISRGEK